MNRVMKFALVVSGAVMSACNGWPDAPPYAESENRPEKYATYAYAPAEAVPVFTAEHHRYMVMPGHTNLRGAKTRQIGSAANASVFALEGDDAPYANLFARGADGTWRVAGVID